MLKLLGASFGLLGVLWLTVLAGQLTGNLSPSAPVGLYLRAEREKAAYVTFCLRADHSSLPFYPRLCSPDSPDGQRIIKQITNRHEDGSLTVTGKVPGSIDSSLLGRIHPDQVRGYWRHWHL
ncbi:hypothetical protein [uncultured Ruegeria sp.]|uniref:hypothetical protein n=1 Tax=uncultured Ruegeria sp. TaxID=259304 RepID=UPI00261FFA13|nr:hypothetical protein [uncultured Ruegeria sp.]